MSNDLRTTKGQKNKIKNCPRKKKKCPYQLLPCLECMDIVLPDEIEISIPINPIKPIGNYDVVECDMTPIFNYFGEGGE